MGRRLLRFRRRLKARLIAAGLTLAVVVTVVGLLGATLARAAPAWWRQYRPTPELREHATKVENAAVSNLYRQRPPDPDWDPAEQRGQWRSEVWSISLKDDDASAWLTSRLPEWIDGQADLSGWPDTLGQPQVHFAAGVVRIGVLLRREGGDRILTASARPEIRADGSLWFRTDWIHVGRLPVPARLLLTRAQRRLDTYLPENIADDPYSAGFLDVLRGAAPLAARPQLKLEDGRVVRLLGVRVLAGRIEFDCRTESQDTLAEQ